MSRSRSDPVPSGRAGPQCCPPVAEDKLILQEGSRCSHLLGQEPGAGGVRESDRGPGRGLLAPCSRCPLSKPWLPSSWGSMIPGPRGSPDPGGVPGRFLATLSLILWSASRWCCFAVASICSRSRGPRLQPGLAGVTVGWGAQCPGGAGGGPQGFSGVWSSGLGRVASSLSLPRPQPRHPGFSVGPGEPAPALTSFPLSKPPGLVAQPDPSGFSLLPCRADEWARTERSGQGAVLPAKPPPRSAPASGRTGLCLGTELAQGSAALCSCSTAAPRPGQQSPLAVGAPGPPSLSHSELSACFHWRRGLRAWGLGRQLPCRPQKGPASLPRQQPWAKPRSSEGTSSSGDRFCPSQFPD